MESKFTLRDFLVYFITGFYFMLLIIYNAGYESIEHIKIPINDLKSNQVIFLFFITPFLYILGQIVHSCDVFLLRLGRLLHSLSKKSESIRKILFVPNCIVNGNRIVGNIKEDNTEFWNKAYKLQIHGKYDRAEYWYIMSDLFKGLTLISFIWLLYYIYMINSTKVLLHLFLVLVFWYRAKYMAMNYVRSVNGLINVLYADKITH